MADIQKLAARISASVAKLSNTKDHSEEAKQTLLDIRSASYELQLAATPPKEWIYSFGHRTTEQGVVQCLLQIGVVSAIPPSGSVTYSDLATKLRVDQDVIERFCRYSATFGFLRETKLGSVEHSPTSKMAADNLTAFQFTVDRYPPAELKMFESLKEDPAASEVACSALSVANKRADGTLPTLWDLLSTDPAWRNGFTSYIQFVAGTSQQGSGGLETAFDWASLPVGSTVVDVGGGRGHISIALAEAFPHLKFKVQDREELVQTMQGHLTTSSGTVVEFVAHDFFTPQPLQAEVYFYRKIFHDWSDKYSKQILSALLPAMKRGSKLIINDVLLPEPQGRPDLAENAARRLDMAMMAFMNGKERSLKQFKTLVCGMDTKLRFDGVATPPGSAVSVMIFTMG